jgi:hypothetical protein
VNGYIRRHAGQKRVEDARKRAYDPAIHPLRKKMDARVKPAHDVGDIAMSYFFTHFRKFSVLV